MTLEKPLTGKTAGPCRQAARRACECYSDTCLFFLDYIAPIVVLASIGVSLIAVHEVFSPSGRLPGAPVITIEVQESPSEKPTK